MKIIFSIRDFFKLESASGILLFFSALFALILNNSPLAYDYQAWFIKPFHFWINEGLMALFFLLVGLELKREFIAGELSSFSKIALPGVAAFGGMLIPALIYIGFNYHQGIALKGWAVPVATDIAFAVGVLSLFGKRVPLGLKLFLLALAIFDDLGAIIIIALFHSYQLSFFSLLCALIAIFILCLFNFLNVRYLFPYLLVGIFLWLCILKSGVHATIVGVLLACTIPISRKANETTAPLYYLEKMLHPWVAYGILPLFALANAGLTFGGLTARILSDSVVLGIIAGLFLGKQCGVFSFAWLMIKLKWAKLPTHTTWWELYGVALLCGIGFTMSLFLGTLAFQTEQPLFLTKIQLGVLLGSGLSAVTGAIILQISFLRKASRKRI